MKINKFGGAAIKDANAIKHMANICKQHINNGIIIVSAMGKTTNLLENILKQAYNKAEFSTLLDELSSFYKNILTDLFTKEHPIHAEIDELLSNLTTQLNSLTHTNFDFDYDQTVSFGEIFSSKIIHAYLNSVGYKINFADIRHSLKTDDNHREANVYWEQSKTLIEQNFNNANSEPYLTQGFLGMDSKNLTTTLGREGSDYTAAILGNMLDAEKVVVWKDVPGILCSDPKWIPNSEKLNKISYLEAVELTYFGAKVIHPKTIKPLQNKNIPLQVRSFDDIQNQGTIISNTQNNGNSPVFMRKQNQVLISIKPLDFSFIVEENLSHIFALLAKNKIKVNIMQNSAISFNIVTEGKVFNGIENAIEELRKFYDVKYNDCLELISVRHTTPKAEQKVINNREILLEQRSRSTVRFVVR